VKRKKKEKKEKVEMEGRYGNRGEVVSRGALCEGFSRVVFICCVWLWSVKGGVSGESRSDEVVLTGTMIVGSLIGFSTSWANRN
jgi:hypothetical protein